MIDLQYLCSNVIRQFDAAVAIERRKGNDVGAEIEVSNHPKTLVISFLRGEERHTVTIPVPYEKDGIAIIQQNEVERAVCKYFKVSTDTTLDYLTIMNHILCDDPTGIIPSYLVKKSTLIRQVVYSFSNGNTPAIVHNLQRCINEVINRMPLHNTSMNSWAMNHRLMMIDHEFTSLSDPKDKLAYQIEKAKRYFDLGWTSIGLSDGVLSDKNYILTTDLRKLTPFGLKHHNPQRNLYSTLGMKGDEKPLLMTRSAKALEEQGITRTGWNLFTAFADVPDVWEDQIIIDKRWEGKLSVKATKRYQCFGRLFVKKGDPLHKGQWLSFEPDEKPLVMHIVADKMWVKDITKDFATVGGIVTPIYNVIVEYERKLKEGAKITNTAANKGVIRFADLGYAEARGTKIKIDVLVSSTSVKRRKNYSQILEAILNNVNGNQPGIVEDDVETSQEAIEARLVKEGFNKDGMWDCHTYAGDFKAVCGTVFWGCTHDADDTVWGPNITNRRNNRDVRTAGLKFSTVEFRALETRFGKSNAVTDEILSYVQGSEDLHEELKILKSKRGEFPDVPIIDIKDVKPVDQTKGTMMKQEDLVGTIVDEHKYPDDFILRLPVEYQSELYMDEKGKPDEIDGPVHEIDHNNPDLVYYAAGDKIYIPSANLRRCWKHQTGRYGLSVVGVLLNNLVDICHRYMADREDMNKYVMVYSAIHTYFAKIANMMGSKRGEIAQLGMAVRYPFSVKAVATLSNSIPKNTVEIHEDMAKQLAVKNGDVVLCERFPCLGFMSVRPQKIRVTSDKKCKFTIRTSGTSLKSTNLDYDGDVIYLASFHTPEAKELLRKEWTNPNKPCYDAIKALNSKCGKPHYEVTSIQDYNISAFPALTKETHAEYVSRATGVKSHTGPVIALAYNIMRLIENSEVANSRKANIGIELFLDKVGNSVFSQKHGTKSLHDVVIEFISKADVTALVEEGFDRGISTIICDLIATKMKEIGLKCTPEWYYDNVTKKFGVNIINKLIREQNKVYFASRAQLQPLMMLYCLEKVKNPVDVPSKMLNFALSGKNTLEKTPFDSFLHKNEKEKLKSTQMQDTYDLLCEVIDSIMLSKNNLTEIVPNKVEVPTFVLEVDKIYYF